MGREERRLISQAREGEFSSISDYFSGRQKEVKEQKHESKEGGRGIIRGKRGGFTASRNN